MRIKTKSFPFKEDRFEQKDKEFHVKVREGYKEIARANSHRIKIIDSKREIEEIHKKIIYLFENLMNEKSKK